VAASSLRIFVAFVLGEEAIVLAAPDAFY